MFTSFYDFICIKFNQRKRDDDFMIECIVNYLCDKFAVKRDVAFIFYMEVLDRYKIEHLIQHIEDFKDFEELKTYYLGGTENEL